MVKVEGACGVTISGAPARTARSALRSGVALAALFLIPSGACTAPVAAYSEPGVTAPQSPAVAISEIMYHPVLENDAEEGHEFIELHNPAVVGVSLAGWKLGIGGRDAFTFPADANLAAGAYLVVAKDRSKVMAAHGLPAAQVLGGYQGELDNGGDTVALVNATGAMVDVVRYDDQFPWPIGADALGAGRAWFPAGEYEKQQYKGRSLERISFDLPASEVRNWEASPTGGGSPGHANSRSGEPPAVVLEVSPRGAVVVSGAAVTVKATLSPGQVHELAVEYFADDLTRPGAAPGPLPRVAMAAQGSEQVAVLPLLPERSIVRYRIVGQRAGAASEVISPRPTDPYGFHVSFVPPAAAPPAAAYQIFIAPDNWTKMWSNLGAGPNLGCEPNPTWDARVPAVVVRNGRVQDVQVRYQGSRYQRKTGYTLPPWPAGTGPAAAGGFKTLSWRLSFPNHDRWVEGKDKRDTITLNKQHQACPGVLNHLASKLQWAAGVRTQRFGFARLYVNGSYYHYMMQVESIDEDLLAKTDPAGAALGDLFKSDGAVDDNQGPWGRGNFRPLQINALCPDRWSKLDRYRTTYERQTHDWKNATPAGHEELIAIIETLGPLYEAAKSSGNWQPVRDLLSKNFDVAQLISHWVVRNFAGVWDDGVHNFYLYKRASDGKYEVLPQDFDLEFGGDGGVFSKPPTATLFLGEEGTGLDPVGGSNGLKSALLKAFRSEFRARFFELLATVLAPDSVMQALNQAQADWDQGAWDESPAQGKCDVPGRMNAARTWLAARYASLAQQGLM